MILYGYAIDYYYSGDGVLMIRTRIPQIHGPYKQNLYGAKKGKTYTRDADLPYYPSLLLPHLPGQGEVVALASEDDKKSKFIVIGLTGGSYKTSQTDVGG